MPMHRYVAPKVLKINGEPAPCECETKGDIEVTCAYCVQANLMARTEKDLKAEVQKPVLETIRKMKIQNVAEKFGVDRTTVHRWLAKKRVPTKYALLIQR